YSVKDYRVACLWLNGDFQVRKSCFSTFKAVVQIHQNRFDPVIYRPRYRVEVQLILLTAVVWEDRSWFALLHVGGGRVGNSPIDRLEDTILLRRARNCPG